MAEKQLAYRASGNDEFFADDDPLAELARIVGFEPRPAAQATPAAQRQEPAFNLEDELLREFERYDTPRMSPANDISAPAEQVSPPSQELVVPPAEPVRTEPTFVEPRFEEPAPQVAAPIKPTIGARDLIDELEMSIAPVLQPAPKAAPVEPPATPVAPVAKTPQSAAATIRLPLANFTLATSAGSMEQVAPVAPPAVAPPAPKTASSDAMFDGALDFEALDIAEPSPVREAASQPVATQPAPAVFMSPEPPKVAKADPAALSAEIDALLADVDRYPVPPRANAPAAKAEPDFGNFGVSFPEPADLPVAPAVAQAEELKPVAFDAEDPFAGQDFEFDLADIEMELAGLDFAEAAKSSAVRQAAPAAPVSEPVVSRATPVAPAPVAPVAAVVSQPIQAAPAPAPVVPSARPSIPVFEAEQALPFDPTEISETEDRVETFEGSHVPHLPAIEPEEPIAVPPEYDFDLDSEMASLLGTPAKEAAPEPIRPAVATTAFGGAAAVASWSKNAAAQPAAPVAKQPIEEFDEFERALEEDFRRSYREAATPVENVARMTLNPAAGSRRPVRSVRGMVTTAAVIVVLGVGAYGAYSWVRHGAPISSFSGEPRVIAADSDPVKVAPENPGGTVVPNQDKAVYDRVAGDSTAAPKQKELVSSNEQPVDVVQKTLIPESISPDDGSADQVTATPVGETEDPRLLPNQNGGNANVAANNSDDQVPAVSPRKVRTMIVKPDGSLVPRDEPAADTTTAVAKPANNQAAPANPRPSAANAQAAAQPDSGDAASAESTPIRVVKTNPVPTARPETAKANTTAPAQSAQPKAQPKQVASASPAAAPAATSAASGGAYGVQIASLPTEADAQKSQANLKTKFASVIGNHPLEIRKADIAGKGTYYRVRVVAGSKDEAAAICERYRAAGGTCLISK